MDIALPIGGFVVYAWLLILVHRQRIREQLRWFAFYVLWEFVAQSVALVSLVARPHLYYNLYWWLELVDIALTVMAVRESFLRIFQGFTRKPGFRWLVWMLIVAVIVYSALRAAYGPPFQVSRKFTFIFDAEFLFRWGFLAIAVLTVILGILMREGTTREDAVVTGFGIAAGGFLLYLGTLSLLGNKYIFLTKYIPSMGYFVAVFWWIYVFSRPVKQFGFEELGMGPDEIREALRRYRRFGEHL
ncbi:MAG TPA: hypothetical protein VI636_09670 [Candidatus Angelobacter sp.]